MVMYLLIKKGTYYCWYKDYYFQSLLNSDPKFRLTYEAIKTLEQSVNKTSDGLAKTVETLVDNISNLSKSTIEKNGHRLFTNNRSWTINDTVRRVQK